MAQRNTIPIWLIPLNLTLAILVGLLVAQVWFGSYHLPEQQLQALRLVHQQIAEEHVDAHGDEELVWSAIEGMVERLDQHSEFIRPSEVSAFEEDTTGTYVGIGVLMVRAVEPVTVQFPFPGGPSERAGLRPGDRIVAVDGARLVAAEGDNLLDAAREVLLGPAGSTVELSVERDGSATLTVPVTRGPVQRPSAKWARLLEPEQRIGYVYLSAFQHHSSQELARAILELHDAVPGGLRGLVLDLRFNRGGLLDQAVAIANLFVGEGRIVSLKRRSSEVEVHDARPERCLEPDLPLVLLVNARSASASEVVAGALQDHGRARLVGTRTYGKGVVQSIFRWDDLDFRLKLTTAHYYTPSGRSIEGDHRRTGDGEAQGGIEPDVVAKAEEEIERWLYDRLVQPTEVPRAYREEVAALSERLDFALPRPPGPADDPQLAAALATLTEMLR